MASPEMAEQPNENDGEVEKVSESVESLELLWKSDEGVADALSTFRECHDLCVRTKLLDDETVLKVDQCAVDFRQLSLESASIAKMVSNAWLETALMVLENLKDMNNSEKILMFKLLCDQAKELSYCFKIFALWAKDVSGRFHEAQDGTVREADDFKQVLEDAIKDGEATLAALEKEQETVSNYRKECETSENAWASKLSETHNSGPYTLVWTRLLSAAEHRSLDAQKSEHVIAKELSKLRQHLEEGKYQHEEAKSTTETIIGPLKFIAHLEKTYEVIATYWITEAEKLKSQCKELEEDSDGAEDVSAKEDKDMEDKMTTWKKAKDEIDDHVKRLSKVNNSFNFETEAKPPEAQSVEFEKLGFTLPVPTTINLQGNNILPIQTVETKVQLSVSE